MSDFATIGGLVEIKNDEIEFRAKAHMIHSFRPAIIAKIGAGKKLNPKFAIQWLEWAAEFSCKEILLLDEEQMAADFVEYARKTRTLPHLGSFPEVSLLVNSCGGQFISHDCALGFFKIVTMQGTEVYSWREDSKSQWRRAA